MTRRTELILNYNQINANEDLKNCVEKFTYTDSVDASDTISLTLHDREKKWMRDWIPNENDVISATIVFTEKESKKLFCGNFHLDEFTFSSMPATCQLNGVSSPVESNFKETENTKTWENINLYMIAKEISEKYNLLLIYDAQKEINISKIEQNGQTDSSFLKDLCQKYGFGMKIYSEKLIIWNYKEYKNRSSVLSITPDMVAKWNYKSSIQGTYTGAKVTYTNADGEELEVKVGKEGRILTVNERADSIADAEIIGESAIDNANRKEITMNITMSPNLSLVATNCVEIKNFGKIDGKYLVEEVTHSLTKTYTQNIRLSKVQQEEKKKGEGKEEIVQDTEYIVKVGDTLWDLAKNFYGSSSKYNIIYEANKENIEETAKKRGLNTSKSGYWIFPGQKLMIPNIEKG